MFDIKPYTKPASNGKKQTWADITIYNGKTYAVRIIKDKDDEDLLIAGDELLNDLHPAEEWVNGDKGFDPINPQEAERVYNEIFFFTDDTTLHYNDDMLRADIAEENPDWFC